MWTVKNKQPSTYESYEVTINRGLTQAGGSAKNASCGEMCAASSRSFSWVGASYSPVVAFRHMSMIPPITSVHAVLSGKMHISSGAQITYINSLGGLCGREEN